jgi:lysophospholipase L1-like esterase
VVAVVYYDEDGDGSPETQELARVPDVEVLVGSRSARSEKGTGRAVVSGVAAGAQTVSVKPDTLPPFYRPGAPVSIQVPLGEGSQVLLPLTLPIGPDSRPNVYMAFGDSLTRGDGSSDGNGYPPRLEALLRAHFADALVTNRGADATNSYEAMERLKRNLAGSLPAYTLILYGTNDWNIPGCQNDPGSCPTADNLRTVVQGVKAFGALPFLATIPPVNPELNPGRNEWVEAIDGQIRPMAREEGAFLVDLYEAFRKKGDITRFFSDGVHFNDAGYQVMADAFFEAIAHGRSVPP